MTREEALDSIKANVENKNLIKHLLATEAIMRAVAARLGEDEEEWGLTGLLHDVDMELTGGDMGLHSRLGADLVRDMGAEETIAHAILSHNEIHGIPLETSLDKALYCVDPLTGLIISSALVRPDKKLAGLTAESVLKKFNEKGFAAGANRQHISLCREIGLELNEFIALGIAAMQGISKKLGL